MLPPLAYMMAFWRTSRLPVRIGCVAIFVFGCATLVVTTTFTIIHIVDRFQNGDAVNITCTIQPDGRQFEL